MNKALRFLSLFFQFLNLINSMKRKNKKKRPLRGVRRAEGNIFRKGSGENNS